MRQAKRKPAAGSKRQEAHQEQPSDALTSLPAGILEAIVSRLPFQQQLALRLVSKSLCSTLSNAAAAGSHTIFAQVSVTLPPASTSYPIRLTAFQQQLLRAARHIRVALGSCSDAGPSAQQVRAAAHSILAAVGTAVRALDVGVEVSSRQAQFQRCIALESLSLAQLNTWGTGQAPLASLAPLTALRRVDLSHLPDGAQLTALSRVTHLTLRHSNIKPESLKHMTSLHTLVGVRLWLLGQADHDTETDQTKDTNPIILPGLKHIDWYAYSFPNVLLSSQTHDSDTAHGAAAAGAAAAHGNSQAAQPQPPQLTSLTYCAATITPIPLGAAPVLTSEDQVFWRNESSPGAIDTAVLRGLRGLRSDALPTAAQAEAMQASLRSLILTGPAFPSFVLRSGLLTTLTNLQRLALGLELQFGPHWSPHADAAARAAGAATVCEPTHTLAPHFPAGLRVLDVTYLFDIIWGHKVNRLGLNEGNRNVVARLDEGYKRSVNLPAAAPMDLSVFVSSLSCKQQLRRLVLLHVDGDLSAAPATGAVAGATSRRTPPPLDARSAATDAAPAAQQQLAADSSGEAGPSTAGTDSSISLNSLRELEIVCEVTQVSVIKWVSEHAPKLTRLTVVSLSGWAEGDSVGRGNARGIGSTLACLSALPWLRDLQLGLFRSTAGLLATARAVVKECAVLQNLVLRLHPENASGTRQAEQLRALRAEVLAARPTLCLAVLYTHESAEGAWPCDDDSTDECWDGLWSP